LIVIGQEFKVRESELDSCRLTTAMQGALKPVDSALLALRLKSPRLQLLKYFPKRYTVHVLRSAAFGS